MSTDESAIAHYNHLTALCAAGRPLEATSTNSSMRNPKWFNARRGAFTAVRRALHTRILQHHLDVYPQVRQDRRAIVLAGPPGAGKSTAQVRLIKETGTKPEHWLLLNADDFKDDLLVQAVEDDSYENFLKPDVVKELEATGERFYPRELAALVHEESSLLAKTARAAAIERGDNIIVDGTLATQDSARSLMDQLAAAGYTVTIANVETSQVVSQDRTEERWRTGYLAAENATVAGRDVALGGRWVPPSFPASLYSGGGQMQSDCEINAHTMAEEYGCVREYALYRVADARSAPQLLKRQRRTHASGPLMNYEAIM